MYSFETEIDVQACNVSYPLALDTCCSFGLSGKYCLKKQLDFRLYKERVLICTFFAVGWTSLALLPNKKIGHLIEEEKTANCCFWTEKRNMPTITATCCFFKVLKFSLPATKMRLAEPNLQ